VCQAYNCLNLFQKLTSRSFKRIDQLFYCRKGIHSIHSIHLLILCNNVRTNLQWKNARVTREFEVILTDSYENPINIGIIKINGQEYVTDETGKTQFSLVFDEANYNKPIILEAWYSGTLIDSQEIDFFTETPLRLKQ